MKATKMNKQWGSIAFLLLLFTVTGCDLWSTRTSIDCIIYNQSGSAVSVVNSANNSQDIIDSTSVPHDSLVNVFSSSEDGDLNEPNEDEFANFGESIKIYAMGELIYTQEPYQKDRWRLKYSSSGDGHTTYIYALTVSDSLTVE